MPPFSSAYRRDGKIVLEIDEPHFVKTALDGSGALRLVDRERFLHFALENIFTLTHDLTDDEPASWWQRLTESLAKAAAATGQGMAEAEAEVPTCGCDPEEHDGG